MKVLKGSKKGQVTGVKNGILALVLAMVLLGVAVVIIAFITDMVEDKKVGLCDGSLQTYDDGDCYSCSAAFPVHNATGNNCYVNSTNTTTQARSLVLTTAINVTIDGLAGADTLSEGTEDTADVSVIVIILTLLFGVLAIFGLGYYRNQ